MLSVGAGRLAPWLVRAHLALNPSLAQVLVWARQGQAAAALAAQLRAEGIDALPRDDLAAAVGDAQIVSCATTATAPVVHGAWLAPGTHLDLVGGFRPDMREVDDAAVARARIVVDTRAGALAEAGDLVQPLACGVIDEARVVGDLAELLRGECAGRTADDQITLFKSVGTALEDLAAAQLVHRCGLAALKAAAHPPDLVDDQQHRAERDGAVGEVEAGEVPAAPSAPG